MVRCGPGVRLVSWPETPTVRATAIGDDFTPARVAALLTAAWIWGVTREPNEQLEFVVLRGRTHDLRQFSAVALHQYQLDQADISRLGPFSVTSPKRTLYDLLRGHSFDRKHRVACRLLLARLERGRSALAAEFPLRHKPYETRMRRRLASL